jgi:DivIVA domain-containing protein
MHAMAVPGIPAGGTIRVSDEQGEPSLATDAEQIRQREFATVRRGYDPGQVRAFLDSVATRVDELERALAESRARVAEPGSAPAASESDPYERLSERFASVLASADTQAQQMVDEAKSEAARIKAEAQAQAEDLRNKGSRTLIAAQEESERMLEDLATRRAAMLRQLHDMQARLLSVADDLESAMQPPAEPAQPEPPTVVPESAAVPEQEAADAYGAGDAPDAATDSAAETDAAPEPVPTHAAAATTDVGIAALFDEPVADEVDLPDLSDIDLDLDLDDERGEG